MGLAWTGIFWGSDFSKASSKLSVCCKLFSLVSQNLQKFPMMPKIFVVLLGLLVHGAVSVRSDTDTRLSEGQQEPDKVDEKETRPAPLDPEEVDEKEIRKRPAPLDRGKVYEKEIPQVPLDLEKVDEKETRPAPLDRGKVYEKEIPQVPLDLEKVDEKETRPAPLDPEEVDEKETRPVPETRIKR